VISLRTGYWVLVRLTTTSKYSGDHKFGYWKLQKVTLKRDYISTILKKLLIGYDEKPVGSLRTDYQVLAKLG